MRNEEEWIKAGERRGMPRRLPIIEHKGKKWFLDERLKQIRNIRNPHDFIDLTEDELSDLKP